MVHVVNVEVKLYRLVINVVVAGNCKEAVKGVPLLKKYFYKGLNWDWKDMYGAYLENQVKNIHAIILAEDAGIDTVTHEVYHCVNGALKSIGVKYSSKSEEAYAYLIGWLVKEVVKVQNEYVDLIKK